MRVVLAGLLVLVILLPVFIVPSNAGDAGTSDVRLFYSFSGNVTFAVGFLSENGTPLVGLHCVTPPRDFRRMIYGALFSGPRGSSNVIVDYGVNIYLDFHICENCSSVNLTRIVINFSIINFTYEGFYFIIKNYNITGIVDIPLNIAKPCISTPILTNLMLIDNKLEPVDYIGYNGPQGSLAFNIANDKETGLLKISVEVRNTTLYPWITGGLPLGFLKYVKEINLTEFYLDPNTQEAYIMENGSLKPIGYIPLLYFPISNQTVLDRIVGFLAYAVYVHMEDNPNILYNEIVKLKRINTNTSAGLEAAYNESRRFVDSLFYAGRARMDLEEGLLSIGGLPYTVGEGVLEAGVFDRFFEARAQYPVLPNISVVMIASNRIDYNNYSANLLYNLSAEAYNGSQQAFNELKQILNNYISNNLIKYINIREDAFYEYPGMQPLQVNNTTERLTGYIGYPFWSNKFLLVAPATSEVKKLIENFTGATPSYVVIEVNPSGNLTGSSRFLVNISTGYSIVASKPVISTYCINTVRSLRDILASQLVRAAILSKLNNKIDINSIIENYINLVMINIKTCNITTPEDLIQAGKMIGATWITPPSSSQGRTPNNNHTNTPSNTGITQTTQYTGISTSRETGNTVNNAKPPSNPSNNSGENGSKHLLTITVPILAVASIVVILLARRARNNSPVAITS